MAKESYSSSAAVIPTVSQALTLHARARHTLYDVMHYLEHEKRKVLIDIDYTEAALHHIIRPQLRGDLPAFKQFMDICHIPRRIQ